jgi:hypothetical protein
MSVDMPGFGGTIKETRGGVSRGFWGLATIHSNQTTDAVQQDYEQFSGALRRQAEQIAQLDQVLRLLQSGQQQLEEAASHLVEPLEKSFASGDGTNALSPSGILSCVRKLAAATYAEQVFDVLAEQAARMNVRSAVFDVRGRAAWAASAGGFDPELSGDNLRTLVVPLNHDGPFRKVFETAEAVETNAAGLEKNRNVVVKFGAAANARVLLVPVRSADSIAAIFYADIGEKRDSRLIDALKVLAEFAGAQIDRLMVLNGGLAGVEPAPVAREGEAPSEPAAGAPGSEIETPEAEVVAGYETPEDITAEASPAEPPGPSSEVEPLSTALPEAVQPAAESHAPAEAAEIARPTEAEGKIHRDARRFSKLLVSEIELYNKSSVEEGRRNKDLYQRLKKDIDRSRDTYEKRFAHTVASEIDYFHEELVRTLAENDPLLLGSGYPGSSV